MYPVTYEADFNPAPNRWTTFFRPILAIPWMIVAVFWGLLFVFTHFFAWISIIVLGRYPDWLYEFNSGVVRFGVRVSAWLYLQTDEWPPFGLSDDPSYPIRVDIAPREERQSRLKALFRLILALPMLLASYAVNYMHLWVAAIAWLTIVFRGYQPEGINTAPPSSTAFTPGSTDTSPSSPTTIPRSAPRKPAGRPTPTRAPRRRRR
jgi:hypothetical protein